MYIPHIYEQVGIDRRTMQNADREIYLFLPIGPQKDIQTSEQLAMEWANER